MKQLFYLLLFFFFVYTPCVFSQFSQNSLSPNVFEMNPVPNAPDVATLERYDDVPVSLYDGTINYGVPLFTLSSKSSLSLPFALNYHTGGVRVADRASSTGTGWSLSNFGRISREVRGAPDLDSNLDSRPTHSLE